MTLIKNGSTPTLEIFLVDLTDGKTPEDGLTLADIDIYVKKSGGSFAAATNTGGAGGSDLAESSRGWYSFSLTATETNTDGELVIEAEDPANSRTWRKVYQVYTNLIHDDEMDDIADHVLRRSVANARSGSGDTIQEFSLLNAVLGVTGKVGPSGSNLIIYQEDGSTPAVTRPMSTSSSADPTTGLGAPV